MTSSAGHVAAEVAEVAERAVDRRPLPDRHQISERPQPDRAGQATPTRPMTAAATRGLQRSAGNRAVSQLMARRQGMRRPDAQRTPPSAGPAAVQRLAGAPVASPAAGTSGGVRGGPGTDPKFAELTSDVLDKRRKLTEHPPAKAEANAAQAAALPPQDDREAQGKTANAEKMNAAKPGEFDKAAFIRAVDEAIAAQAPKNLDEADKFGESGKACAVKDQVSGQVTAGTRSPQSTSGGWMHTRTSGTPGWSARAGGSRTSSPDCQRKPTRSS